MGLSQGAHNRSLTSGRSSATSPNPKGTSDLSRDSGEGQPPSVPRHDAGPHPSRLAAARSLGNDESCELLR